MKTLEAITDAGGKAIDIFQVITEASYGASLKNMEYRLSRKAHSRELAVLRRKQWDMLYRLKRDNLVLTAPSGKLKKSYLTAAGKNKLLELKKKLMVRLSLKSPQPVPAKNPLLILFDVPETERIKREYLRIALKDLQFTMLQESVWIGKSKVPPEFVDFLSRNAMLDYVEILEVTKAGTTKRLV